MRGRWLIVLVVVLSLSILVQQGPVPGTTSQDVPVFNQSGDQVLIYALPYQVSEFSYWAADSYMTEQWSRAVYVGLYSRQSALNREYGPELAASMPTISQDGLEWIVDLKAGLLFDNGNPITADDVVFSYQVALTPSINKNSYTEFALWFASNDSIETVDSDTVKFTLTSPYPFTLGLLTGAVIDKSLYEDRYNDCVAGDAAACDWNAEDGSDTIGTTGPYVVDSIDTTNNIITVTKNFNYWNQENVWADTIIF